MDFQFKGIDTEGSRHQGNITALNNADAQKKLQADGIHVIELIELSNKKSLKDYFQRGISLDELEFFTSQLSLLLESGVRVDKGIEIIQQTNSQPALNKLLFKISASLKKGSSLSAAFSEHEELFDPLYISLLEIGETSGNLPEVLKKLADDLKFRKELKAQISQALTYPSVIMFVCLAAVYFVLTFIVPKMSGIFTDITLAPWYTQMIIGVSNFFVAYEHFIIGGIIAAIFAVSYAYKQAGFRNWCYVTAAKIPGIGKIILTSERIRFASSMAMMLEAGLQLDTTFDLTSNTLKHEDLKREAKQALGQLKSGKQLSFVLSKTQIFPEFFLSIIKVGEETGTLPRVFNEVASRSRTDLDAVIKKLTTLLEPLMLVFMGGFVGGIVISMLMSMVSINDVPF
ncbi:type II secretion system F family protein [Colwellia sp. 1_MG-2023]|uniref:type II secretion system F family protein n=1 Tax=Colwellia sp. 1_MG-2023 TaxID=3062649 RepID=UPI0026E19F3B|nr:type II secretion system F family protein [Colwellia sp. 1_MG-2023]MDO6444338.1 type II secretion system F family protein [Colwellia sp. 1_MG-2023]